MFQSGASSNQDDCRIVSTSRNRGGPASCASRRQSDSMLRPASGSRIGTAAAPYASLLPSATDLLTSIEICSHFVLMSIETIGEAYSLGWRVTARCAHGREDGPSSKSSRQCIYRKGLDMETLVWTRGKAFPLSRLESRLRCPRCGSRNVVVLFQPPTNVAASNWRS